MNKPQSTYAARIDQVIDYIQSHLYHDLSVERLAKLVHFSKFHFHRQFSAYTGISVFRLIQLLRLKEASYRLVFNPQERITDIALAAGFENAESFSRAFKKLIGQTPSAFREAPQWTPWLEKYAINQLGGSRHMLVDIVEFEQTRVAVFQHRGDPARLNDSLQKFVQWRKANKLNPRNSSTYNIVYDDPATVKPEDYRFDICAAVDREVPENGGISNQTIPGGRCAVLSHQGSSDNIGDSVSYLYQQRLPTSGEELRDFPLFFHRVTLFPAQVPEHEQITDIYLPLE